METVKVPPVGYSAHTWLAEQDGMSSRSRIARGSGEYRAAIPAAIGGLQTKVPSSILSLVEEATSSLIRFDMYAQKTLGHTSPTLGPLASILLRTESSSSSQIENLTAGARQLALAEIDQSNSANAKIVAANVHAMEAALDLAGRLDSEAILRMHKALLGGQAGWEKHAGTYREQLVWVGASAISPKGASFVAPQADLVGELVSDLVSYMSRSDIPVMVQVAIAHAQFETIHPFVDGNGRTGRALVHALLRGKGVLRNTTAPVSAGLLRQTRNYFEALTSYREGDAQPIISAFSDAAIYAADTGQVLIDNLSAELESAREKLAGLRQQSMAWKLLPYLVSYPVMNSDLVARVLDTSTTSALRALHQLQERAIVQERSGQKRNRVWQHEGILEILDAYAAGLLRKI